MSDQAGRQHSLDPDVLDCLTDVRAELVALTLSTRVVRLDGMIVEEACERLANRLQDVSRIDVRLVWDPVWKPDFITLRGQKLLGRTPRIAV